MTENERVALRWARNYLRGHHCDRCGREWITGASTSVLVHACTQPRLRRRATLPEPRGTTREELHSELFGALVEAQGPESIWRPIEDDQ